MKEDASQEDLDQLRAGLELFGKNLSEASEMAKYILGGVGALLFFVVNYTSGLIDNESFGFVERVVVAFALFFNVMALAVCFWNFFFQYEYQQKLNKLIHAIKSNDGNNASSSMKELIDFKNRLKKIKLFQWSVVLACFAAILSFFSFLVVLFI